MTTMSAAEEAASKEYFAKEKVVASFLRGKTALALLSNPGLLSPYFIEQFGFASIPSNEEDPALDGLEWKCIGSLPETYWQLFAAIGYLSNGVVELIQLATKFATEHNQRHDRGEVGTETDTTAGEGVELDGDPGCLVMDQIHDCTSSYISTLKNWSQLFWGHLKEEFPDARKGDVKITQTKTLVKVISEEVEDGPQVQFLRELLTAICTTPFFMSVGQDDDEDGDIFSSNPSNN